MNLNKRKAAIILAAGAASRMGEPKQLLAIKGKSMLRHTINTAKQAGYDDIILVIGAYANEIKADIKNDSSVCIVINEYWQEGIGTSIRAGIRNILQDKRDVHVAVITLCDQPLITPDLHKKLMEVQKATGKHIVACSYGNSIGVPALFCHPLFEKLAVLEGDTGAKKVIQQHIEDVATLPFAGAAVDLDTMHDYHKFIEDQ